MDTLEFILKGKGSNLVVDFREPIIIPVGYEAKLGLKGFVCYNNIPNITWNENNTIRLKAPGKNYEMCRLPTGAYELSYICTHMCEFIETLYPDLKDVDENFVLLGDEATSKTEIIFKDNYGIDFNTENSIHEVLGFEKDQKFEGKGRYVSKNIVNITNVTQLIFCCNVIEASYINEILVPFIFNCAINVPPGFRMTRELTRITYKKLNTRQICSIRVWIVDEFGKAVDLREDTLIVTLSLKFIKKDD